MVKTFPIQVANWLPNSIYDMDNIKAALMLLTVLDDTNAPSVSPTSHHDNVTDVKLDELHNLASFNVDLHCVIHLDQRIRVPVHPYIK
jgi:hypothetical protein